MIEKFIPKLKHNWSLNFSPEEYFVYVNVFLLFCVEHMDIKSPTNPASWVNKCWYQECKCWRKVNENGLCILRWNSPLFVCGKPNHWIIHGNIAVLRFWNSYYHGNMVQIPLTIFTSQFCIWTEPFIELHSMCFPDCLEWNLSDCYSGPGLC